MPTIKLVVEGYKCNNCKHEWQPRSKKEVPLVCPKCKSPRWNKEKKK